MGSILLSEALFSKNWMKIYCLSSDSRTPKTLVIKDLQKDKFEKGSVLDNLDW